MVSVEPWTVPAMLIGDRTIDAVRIRAINTELFTIASSRAFHDLKLSLILHNLSILTDQIGDFTLLVCNK